MHVGERARANESDGIGIRDAEIAARSTDAVVTGREVFGMIGETIARQQELQDVAAVFGADSVLTQERRDFIDLEAGVVRVTDVGEGVDASARHPRDEFAVVAEMQFEAVGKVVVPGHDVGDEGAALEGGRDAAKVRARRDGRDRCADTMAPRRAETARRAFRASSTPRGSVRARCRHGLRWIRRREICRSCRLRVLLAMRERRSSCQARF